MEIFFIIYGIQVFLAIGCTVFYMISLNKVNHLETLGLGYSILTVVCVMAYTLIPLMGFVLIYVFLVDAVYFIKDYGKEAGNG